MIRGKLTGIRRLQNSRDGNPKWRLFLQLPDGEPKEFVTKTDSMVGHMISEYLVGKTVEVTPSSRGVIDCKVVDDERAAE